MSKEVEVIGNDIDSVINKEGYTFVRFTAPWCGPCRMVAPVVEELSEEITDVVFLKVNTDDNADTAVKHGVRSIPYFIILDKDGNKVTDAVGANSKQTFIDMIDAVKKNS